jgi:hypothetical protein
MAGRTVTITTAVQKLLKEIGTLAKPGKLMPID